ncbi:MAG: hypothetical protein ABI775_08725 [Pseudonocardiales bacterium]|nr:hypothetical protein [Actinomycetota bacterium]
MREVPSGGKQDGAQQYEIRIKGHLAPRWADWFDGMTLTCHDDGTTVIHGTVADQSALHGLLRKLNDLGVPLLSVAATSLSGTAANQVADGGLTDPTALTHHTRRSTT